MPFIVSEVPQEVLSAYPLPWDEGGIRVSEQEYRLLVALQNVRGMFFDNGIRCNDGFYYLRVPCGCNPEDYRTRIWKLIYE